MERYALLGTYEQGDRNNIEVIATSDGYGELMNIRDAINAVNEKLVGKDRDVPDAEVDRIIEEYLQPVDIAEELTGFIYDITILGIFEVKKVDPRITITCPECGKILFKGTEGVAKRLIIYCTECADCHQSEKNHK